MRITIESGGIFENGLPHHWVDILVDVPDSVGTCEEADRTLLVRVFGSPVLKYPSHIAEEIARNIYQQIDSGIIPVRVIEDPYLDAAKKRDRSR